MVQKTYSIFWEAHTHNQIEIIRRYKMKRNTILFLGMVLLVGSSYSQTSDGTRLTIKIQGIKSKKGSISIALYKSDSDFKHEKYSYVNRILANSNGKVIFEKIDKGIYGVAVFHDENDNFKLDTNLLGIPKEGYGFSNNAKGKFGPPGFKDTAVSMNKPEVNLTIKLNY